MKKFLFCLMLMALTLGLYSQPVQVGDEIAERFETQHPYQGQGVVYEKVFHNPDSGYIALHFSGFDLKAGDFVEISSPDGRFSFAYTDKGKVVRGGQAVLSEFWASHIPGDTAVVKLYSNSRKGGWGFVIDKWVAGYAPHIIEALLTGVDSFDADVEAICSSDDKEWAKCYDGTTMYEKARAVARLLMNGSSACTGWLLGSEGHVMTNNHCVGSQNTADNTDFEFMAEGATCTTGCASWFACPGTVVATSGTLEITDSSLDYSLIRLPTNVTSTYGYLQLRNSLPSIGERIYIPQHPGAWGKQLAVFSDVDGGYCDVYSTSTSPCTGGPGDIGYYCDTAGGSSGSPVLAYNDHLVIALHHCADCPNRGVPIPAIIGDMGSYIPNDAIGGSTPPGPPAAPSNLSGKGLPGRVNLSWSDNSYNEDGFKIYRGTTSSNLEPVATVGANTTSFTDSNLARKTTYYYKVCAYNTEGETCTSVISVNTK